MKLFILTINNYKTLKGVNYGWKIGALNLLPHRLSGVNICPKASSYCISNCNAWSGHSAINKNESHFKARLERTELVLQNQNVFKYLLERDIKKIIDNANLEGLKVAIRLNCFSDLDFRELVEELNIKFPEVVFYDYTKVFNYLVDKPKNYHLTFSWSGTNEEECKKALELGFNVAVPFYGRNIPKEFLGYEVIEGDSHDLRFLDETPKIVSLRYKHNKQVNLKGQSVKWAKPKSPFVILT